MQFENLSDSEWELLFKEYLIPKDDNLSYSENVRRWLTPKETPVIHDNPISAIVNRSRFVRNGSINQVYKFLGIDQIILGQQFLSDLENFPINDSFGDPLQLMKSFARSPDSYLQTVTGIPSDRFLNNVEKLFFLTHGYGRPNLNIGIRDYSLRQIYKSACGTALIALSDLFGLCPTRQVPQIIREHLSSIPLFSIDSKHQNAVERVSLCCREDRTDNCLNIFFRSIGMLEYYDYDPVQGVYLSNLSQIELYSKVIPDKKWNFLEIANQPESIVWEYLDSLPDPEILKVDSATGISLRDYLKLDSLESRLRSKLIKSARNFLTSRRYFFDSTNQIVYGRMADTQLESWSYSDFLNSIGQFGYLVDPKGRPFSITIGEEIKSGLKDTTYLDQAILKTRTLDGNYLNQIPENIRKTFSEDCTALLEYPICLSDLREFLLQQDDLIRELPLKFCLSGWFTVGLTFNEYLLKGNVSSEILERTLQYYSKVFAQ